MKRQARLILDDGTTFCGWAFGAEKNVSGEVVFNTAMTGYPESLTDPSYAGQMLVMTYPLVGNYGVPSTEAADNGLPELMESERIHATALIVADYSETYSHWNAKESLDAWLKREGVPALTGIDTRRLTKVLRESGVMMGRIELSEELRVKSEEGLARRPEGESQFASAVESVSPTTNLVALASMAFFTKFMSTCRSMPISARTTWSAGTLTSQVSCG